MASRLAASNLLAGVYNRTGASAAAFAAATGVTSFATPADLARASNVIVTMVTDDAASHSLFVGNDGFLEGLRAGVCRDRDGNGRFRAPEADRLAPPAHRVRPARRAGVGQRRDGPRRLAVDSRGRRCRRARPRQARVDRDGFEYLSPRRARSRLRDEARRQHRRLRAQPGDLRGSRTRRARRDPARRGVRGVRRTAPSRRRSSTTAGSSSSTPGTSSRRCRCTSQPRISG